MNLFQQFFAGVLAPITGLSLFFKDRTLRRLCLWPFVIYIVLFVAGFFGFSFLSQLASSWAVSFLGAVFAESFWGMALLLFSQVLGWVACIIALGYGIFLVANVIGSPFYALMAEKILKDRGLLPEQTQGARDWTQRNVRLVFQAFIKSLVFLVFGVVLFLISFIPVIGLPATFGFFLIIAFDSSDYAYEGVLWGFSKRLRFFISHWAAYMGLAFGVGVFFLFPILNVFLFPLAVLGATDLFVRIQNSKN